MRMKIQTSYLLKRKLDNDYNFSNGSQGVLQHPHEKNSYTKALGEQTPNPGLVYRLTH